MNQKGEISTAEIGRNDGDRIEGKTFETTFDSHSISPAGDRRYSTEPTLETALAAGQVGELDSKHIR